MLLQYSGSHVRLSQIQCPGVSGARVCVDSDSFVFDSCKRRHAALQRSYI